MATSHRLPYKNNCENECGISCGPIIHKQMVWEKQWTLKKSIVGSFLLD